MQVLMPTIASIHEAFALGWGFLLTFFVWLVSVAIYIMTYIYVQNIGPNWGQAGS